MSRTSIPTMKSGSTAASAINVDSFYSDEGESDDLIFTGKSWKGKRPQATQEQPVTVPSKRKRVEPSSSVPKTPPTTSAMNAGPEHKVQRTTRATAATRNVPVYDLCSDEDGSVTVTTTSSYTVTSQIRVTRTQALARQATPSRPAVPSRPTTPFKRGGSAATTSKLATLIPDSMHIDEDEKSPSPQLGALDDAFVYSLDDEAGLEPIAPSAQWLLYTPVDTNERSPSPHLGPLTDDIIFSMKGWTITKVEKDDNVCDWDDFEPRITTTKPPRNLWRPPPSLHPTYLRSRFERARDYFNDFHVHRRNELLVSLRNPLSIGTGLRALDYRRHADAASTFSSPIQHASEMHWASGSTNVIAQRGGWIAAGCSTNEGDGGELQQRALHVDETGRPRRPAPTADNKPNTLSIYNHKTSQWRAYPAHVRDLGQNDTAYSEGNHRIERHFTVNIVAWDPLHEARLISCGMDGSLAMWEPDDANDGSMKIVYRWDTHSKRGERARNTQYVYNEYIDTVAFSPDEAAFVVANSKTGQAYVHQAPYDEPDDPETFELPGTDSVTVDLEWGHGATKGVLFAGVHGAYRIDGSQLYTFRNLFGGKEKAIDALVVDPVHGNRLAIVTHNGSDTVVDVAKNCLVRNVKSRYLHLYDVGSSNSSLIFSNELLFPTNRQRKTMPEITCASFSPDGVLLALGSTDNSTYVYDTRFLHKDNLEYLYRFRHSSRLNKEKDVYGVTQLIWARERGMMSFGRGGYALYSGGADGAVRKFRTDIASESPHNGSVVAQMPAGVGTFSIGDPFIGEKMLVVGDNDGRIGIWDKPGYGF